MRCRAWTGLCALVVLWGAGCASSARLVKWDADGGIVAIPSNNNYWPAHYRDQAEALMQKKCPAGYQIVREEEVTVGQKAHTDSETDSDAPGTFVVGGEKSNKSDTRRGGASVALPFGENCTTTHQTTTYSDVTEYRIWFKPK
jgi:hypothetical protein